MENQSFVDEKETKKKDFLYLEIDRELKEKIRNIAKSKGISLAAYVRLKLQGEIQ